MRSNDCYELFGSLIQICENNISTKSQQSRRQNITIIAQSCADKFSIMNYNIMRILPQRQMHESTFTLLKAKPRAKNLK